MGKTSIGEEPERTFISRDTEVLLFASILARVYWTLSPPTVLDSGAGFGPGVVLRLVVYLDLICSTLAGLGIFVLGWKSERVRCKVPRQQTWPSLIVIASIISLCCGRLLFDKEEAQPGE